MEWKSLLIGFIVGALIAVPLGIAHSGGFNMTERIGGFGPMHMGMMDDEMHDQMENYMKSGNFTGMHDEREPVMEKYMAGNWTEMHEYCERSMGIEDEDENDE